MVVFTVALTQRGERPQGRDHQGRQQAPEEDAGRGRVALPDVLGAAEGPRQGPGPGPGRPEACRQGRAEAGREAGGAARARGPRQQGERGHGARARLLGMGGRPHGRGGVGGGPPHISQSPRKRFDPKPLRRTSGPFLRAPRAPHACTDCRFDVEASAVATDCPARDRHGRILNCKDERR